MAKDLTANEKELVEKWVEEIMECTQYSNDFGTYFPTISEYHAADILTRFLSEVRRGGVDVEKVFDALVAIWAPTYADPDSTTTPSQQFTFHTTLTKEHIAAAISAAGGGKNE